MHLQMCIGACTKQKNCDDKAKKKKNQKKKKKKKSFFVFQSNPVASSCISFITKNKQV
jgi:hypothetical protein